MSVPRPLRVLIVADEPPPAAWHRRVIEEVRSDAIVELTTPDRAAASTPDVIIDLAGIPTTMAPRLGVWRCAFGDGEPFAAGARGTLARVYRLGPDPSRAAVLREGWFRAASDEAPGSGEVGDQMATWCKLLLREIAIDPAAFDDRRPVPISGCDVSLPPPTRIDALTSLREAVGRWKRQERWTIGFAAASIDQLLSGVMDEPRWLAGTPANSYLADPFPLVVEGDRVSLLAEEFRYSEGRGRIVRVDAGRDGRISGIRPLLDRRHHLAYPFILRDGDDVYCVPDGSGAERTSAFSIGSSAATEHVLLPDFPAVDPTIVQHDGRWWLFCTRAGVANQTDLYVFEADRWRGPWRPHPLNPVKSDARSSRPAGGFFTHNGSLFRPAQDCSRRYGGAVAINRIVALSPRTFREETICTLRPSAVWEWPDGLHTFNIAGDFVVVDALRVER
jgi:hypothetical protein